MKRLLAVFGLLLVGYGAFADVITTGGGNISLPVNTSTGTAYTIADGQRGSLVTFSNAAAVAVTLPQAGASSIFLAGWYIYLENQGAGLVTVTPTTSTIDGATTLVLTRNSGVQIFSDGTNYFSIRGASPSSILNNYSTTSQTPAAATRTYITGSNIAVPSGKALQIGTTFHWTFNMTKTAAGTAASTIDIAVGTAGTTADTARVSFTKPAGTAAIDEGMVTIDAIVRGPLSASGIVTGEFVMTHNGNTVGHMTIPVAVVNTVSSAFDVTTANLIVGLCITSGASDAITIQQVTAHAINL